MEALLMRQTPSPEPGKEDGMPVVEQLSSEQIVSRRAHLLARAALPEKELRERARVYDVTPEQAAIVDELDDLDWLLQP